MRQPLRSSVSRRCAEFTATAADARSGVFVRLGLQQVIDQVLEIAVFVRLQPNTTTDIGSADFRMILNAPKLTP